MGLTHRKCNFIAWLQQDEGEEEMASAREAQVLSKTMSKVDEIERTHTHVPLTTTAITRQAQSLLQ